jgi:ubiquinone/menaquinone biosynthesis C-methylase UbiE
MVLYDLVAPAYDPLFRRIYQPFRTQALELLPQQPGAVVLDLACGTGQNFPLLASRIGHRGRIIGLDISSGMLRQARHSVKLAARDNVTLVKMDARALSPTTLKEKTGLTSVDFVVCTYGFTAMREWELPFHRSFSVLKPGGGYLMHDIYAEKRTFHSWAVEKVTRTQLSRKVWQLLEKLCPDFHMEFIDPSQHLFGGRLFVAYGTK